MAVSTSEPLHTDDNSDAVPSQDSVICAPPSSTVDASLDLDSLLNLEETFYAEGFALGKADGIESGRREGRAFGLSRGYERFAAMGRLHGRAVVWSSRLQEMPQDSVPTHVASENVEEVEKLPGSSAVGHDVFLPDLRDPDGAHAGDDTETQLQTGPDLEKLRNLSWKSTRANPRLRKHVALLYGLTEPESLDVQNTEDAVADFDDRLKRATAKAGIVGKLFSEGVFIEDPATESSAGQGKPNGNQDVVRGNRSQDLGIEDVDLTRVRH